MSLKDEVEKVFIRGEQNSDETKQSLDAWLSDVEDARDFLDRKIESIQREIDERDDEED